MFYELIFLGGTKNRKAQEKFAGFDLSSFNGGGVRS